MHCHYSKLYQCFFFFFTLISSHVTAHIKTKIGIANVIPLLFTFCIFVLHKVGSNMDKSGSSSAAKPWAIWRLEPALVQLLWECRAVGCCLLSPLKPARLMHCYTASWIPPAQLRGSHSPYGPLHRL